MRCYANFLPVFLFHLSLKIKSSDFAVFHSECRVFFVCHLVEIGLDHPGNPVVCHEDIGFVIGFFFDLIEEIVDPLCQMQHGFSTVVSGNELLLCFLEFLAVAGSRFVFAEILLDQSRLYTCRDSGDLRRFLPKKKILLRIRST